MCNQIDHIDHIGILDLQKFDENEIIIMRS